MNKITKTFFSFEGRFNRQKYLLAALGMSPLTIIMQILIMQIAGGAKPGVITPILMLLYLIMLWVSLAILSKRLHDINRTGWSILWALVPIVGPFLLLYWIYFKKGTEGPNRFGEDPLRPGTKHMNGWKVFFIMILVMVISCGVSGYFIYSTMQKASAAALASPAYAVAKDYIANSPEVTDITGNIIGSDINKTNGIDGYVIYDIDVHGDKGSANVEVHLTGSADEWKVIAARVEAIK